MNTIDRAFVRLNVISNHLNMEGTSNKCQNPLKVCVTGAAGQIAYSLLPMIACGQMFGPSQPVILHLLDIPQCEKAMQGVVMELDDGAFPLLRGVVATSDVNVAFKGVDVAVLVGAFPRMKGMERKDLLAKNITIFREQGRAINAHASRNVKVLVVGNPANTNCLIAKHFAPDIPATNFSALTRLDHNRAKAQVAQRLSVPISSVHNVFIWGNHSSTQYPDVNHGSVNLSNGQTRSVRSAINDDNYLNTSFIHTVQTRGAAIIEARKLSSAASAARAVCDHIRDWVNGTPKDEAVSMAVPSDGSYGIPEGVIYSYPVTCQGGKYTIVQGLNINKFSREKMDLTYAELLEEKQAAFQLLN